MTCKPADTPGTTGGPVPASPTSSGWRQSGPGRSRQLTALLAGKRFGAVILAKALSGLTQAAKRRARGYRTETHFIVMIYMTAGKLDFGLPT